MKPKWITDKVIENSKKIHELGGRFEIERSNWILHDSSDSGFINVTSDPHADWANENKSTPIWSARKCKEWLRGKGFGVVTEIVIESMCGLKREDDPRLTDFLFAFKAPTEDEACQMAVIKVL